MTRTLALHPAARLTALRTNMDLKLTRNSLRRVIMANKNTSVFAIFATPSSAEAAVDRLVSAGFSQENISVLMSDIESTREFAHEKNTKAPEGAAWGVTA